MAHAGDAGRIRADAASMRARMLRDLPPDGAWDVKLRAGGQIEVEPNPGGGTIFRVTLNAADAKDSGDAA